MLVMMRSNTYI